MVNFEVPELISLFLLQDDANEEVAELLALKMGYECLGEVSLSCGEKSLY